MKHKLNSYVLVALIAVACSVTVFMLMKPHSATKADNTAGNNAAFQRVMTTHVLRCSYVPYAPANIIDPNSKAMSGITIWARSNDNRFDEGISALNHSGITIAGEDGSVASQLVPVLLPNAALSALPQNAPYSLKLDNVKTGKADATFVESYIGEDYVAHNPGSLKNITAGNPVSVYPNVFVVNKGEFKLQSMLQGAMNILHNNGTIERIMKRYDTYPNTLLRVNKPYQG